MNAIDFIAAIASAAQASMHSTRIPASFVIAEAALESAWGDSLLAKKGMNLFGVKADASWKGPTLTMQTREFLHGAWCVVPALWRKYDDWLGCINDHAEFLIANPRYRSAFSATDGEAFAQAVAAAGYATDPLYAQKLISIMRMHNLKQYDTLESQA